MNIALTTILILGIIFIKILWLRTELKFSHDRLNFTMIKTNGVEALILVAQILAAIYTPLPQMSLSWLFPLIGTLIYVYGFVIAVWGKQVMNQSWGVPGVHEKKQSKLVTSGPFTFSRNPLYVGFLMLYFGFAIAIQSWLIILRIPLAIYLYKSTVREEANLEKIFGKEYLEYKKRVPRFL